MSKGVPRAEIERWVGRARNGDLCAWGQLYAQFYDVVFRRVVSAAGCEATAEDIVQETFARAWKKLPSFDSRSSFSTWLHGIARNTLRNHWRAERYRDSARDELEVLAKLRLEGEDDGHRLHRVRECSRVLMALVDDLPEPLRAAFVLREFDGVSTAEGASHLSITPGNFSVRVARARERIRDGLERLGVLPDEAPESESAA